MHARTSQQLPLFSRGRGIKHLLTPSLPRIKNRSLPLRLRIEIHHPVDPESIREHPEVRAPERIRQRHGDLPSSGQSVEELVGLGLAVRVDGDREVVALRHLRSVADGVTAHERGSFADGIGNVHYPLLVRIGYGHFGIGGHFPETADHGELSAENGLVEGEGGFAVAVESEVGDELWHDRSSWVFGEPKLLPSPYGECQISPRISRAIHGKMAGAGRFAYGLKTQRYQYRQDHSGSQAHKPTSAQFILPHKGINGFAHGGKAEHHKDQRAGMEGDTLLRNDRECEPDRDQHGEEPLRSEGRGAMPH